MSASVFFFGGFNATKNDIGAWVGSAKQQKPNIDFYGFPWTSGPTSTPAKSVAAAFMKTGQYQPVIDAIQGDGADKIHLVGHSSGCAIANALDNGLEYTEDIVLVALDGFTADSEQLSRSSTQVWGLCAKA
jgi:hypothetical protein